MFNIVKKAIDDLNPMGLLPHAPDDEYDIESGKIACKINKFSAVDDIAEIISIVLSKAFNEEFEIEKCIPTAEKIYVAIKNQ